MKYFYITIILLCFAFFNSMADDLNKAKELFNTRNYAAALPLFTNLIESQPKSKNIGQLNQWAGECAYHLRDYKTAENFFKKAAAKNITEANHFLGQIAFFDYDFDSASEYYAKFQQLIQKAKKEIPADVADEMARVSMAETMLDRVEKITIIDSIAVPRKNFFKHYKISPDCGSLNSIDSFPFKVDQYLASPIFTNQDNDFMIWSANTDSVFFGDNYYELYESVRLIDNSWQTPTRIDINLEDKKNALYPFMMSDGATLYFASNGANSIGGYDIFISRKDHEENSYMPPTNIGMPYNSPYNDYMMAIDENLGIGWWATDRNNLDNNMITIYVFIQNDIRENYNADDENIANYAKISDYKSTWGEIDYSNILNQISLIDYSKKNSNPDFQLIIKPGVVYTCLEDFKSIEGKKYMKEYLKELKRYEQISNRLSDLRKQYFQTHSNSLVSEFQSLEIEIEQQRKKLQEIKSNIYKFER